MVIDSLERLIRNCAARHESLVCEGVHLSLNFVMQLMQRNPTVIPFLIYISNEDKHKERFAVSASSVSPHVCVLQQDVEYHCLPCSILQQGLQCTCYIVC